LIEYQCLREPRAANALSREREGVYICWICGLAEGYMNYLKLDFDMVRIALENDRQEAMRLPPGDTWGALHPFPTGGLHD
jgi:hypothetical protein